MTDVQNTILRTLAYFDVNDYPMTIFEIWQWQMKPKRIYTYEETVHGIKQLGVRVQEYKGYYSLPYRIASQMTRERHRRYLFAIRKYRRIKKLAWYLGLLPHIEAVAICNTRLPFHFSKDESDIDLFVIAKRGHAWGVRLIALLPLKIFKQRPGERKKDAFDMSFIADSGNLYFSDIALKQDIYLASWIAAIQPVIDKRGIFNTFLQKNAWVYEYFPNIQTVRRPGRQSHNRYVELPLMIPESLAMRLQRITFTDTIKEKQNKNSSVVVHSGMLKMHVEDRRPIVHNTYHELCASIGIPS